MFSYRPENKLAVSGIRKMPYRVSRVQSPKTHNQKLSMFISKPSQINSA